MPISKDIIKVIIKPNSPKNEIICFDSDKQAYRVNIKAKAENNKDFVISQIATTIN